MKQRPQEDGEERINRRTFVKAGAATALTAASWSRVSGANDRIGIGMIGIGLMGRIHTRNFAKQPDVSMVGICDTYDPRADVGAEIVGGNVIKCRDFRKLLDNKDIDAVVVATPDHWHALMTMMACAAGKDVYVEKPLTLFVREGRWMIDVAKRYKRVVQVGVQNRSGPNFQRAREFIQQGKLGQIVAVQDTYCRNLMPGFGNPPDQEPPKELDWDMWLGPAPQRAYNPNRGIYHFRWIWDYAGGQMTNLGQHSLDIVQWFTGANACKSVYSTGGRTYLKDNMETPDSQDVLIDYPGFTGICVYREATAGREGLGMGGVMFYGTHGMMSVGRGGYEVFPDRKVNPIQHDGQHPGRASGGRAAADARSPRISSGPRRRRTPAATAPRTMSRTRGTSSTASARASSPSPTSRVRTRWRRRATWPTSPCASDARSPGTPPKNRSWATRRPTKC